MMRRYLLLLSLYVPFFCSFAADKLTVREVEAAMAESGPHRLPEKYFDCESKVYDAIATGAPEWVALAERAKAASDGCVGEALVSSLGSAMRRHPENVLPLVGKTRELAAEYICIPFISSEIPVAQQRRELRLSRRAIAKAKGFPRQKAACLSFIDALEKSPLKMVR